MNRPTKSVRSVVGPPPRGGPPPASPDLLLDYEIAAEDQPLKGGSLSVPGAELLRELGRANRLDWG